MKVVVQRVSEASVKVDGKTVGEIGHGMVVLLGVTHEDSMDQTEWLANKLVNLRIFKDDNGKKNRSLLDTKGEALIISQFTLYADCSDGRRPSFIKAAPPELATPLYEGFVEFIRASGIKVATGIFGANMEVALINDGPVTIILER